MPLNIGNVNNIGDRTVLLSGGSKYAFDLAVKTGLNDNLPVFCLVRLLPPSSNSILRLIPCTSWSRTFSASSATPSDCGIDEMLSAEAIEVILEGPGVPE